MYLSQVIMVGNDLSWLFMSISTPTKNEKTLNKNRVMGKTYIIEFRRREQYDCNCNCEVKSYAKTFDENTPLSEVVEWVKKQAGLWFDDYNILTNPQILGITKE